MVFIPSGSITDNLANPGRGEWLRSVWVYNKYLNAQIKQRETAPSSVLAWYEMRFHEINTTMVQSHRKQPLILDRPPSVPFKSIKSPTDMLVPGARETPDYVTGFIDSA
jgi:hypothetical protein